MKLQVLFLCIAILACASFSHAEEHPVLRVNLLGASVINSDGDDENKATERDPWKPWSYLTGDTDSYVLLHVGNPDHAFSTAAQEKVESTVAHDNLTPTWRELFSFGPQGKETDLYYQVKDSAFFGSDRILAEGKIDIAAVYGSEQKMEIDMDKGQKLELYITWSDNKPCPHSARHPRHRYNWFGTDEMKCVCDRKYENVTGDGQCGTYPHWVTTCGYNMLPRERPNHCTGKLTTCVDFDHELMGEKCAGKSEDEPCKFFECKW